MDSFILSIYLREVELQCRFALSSAHDLKAAITLESHDAIWKHLQALLIASAALSKMFWGSRGKSEAARTRLREVLQVENDSPIRDVDLRNDFEHFDERLESWYAKAEHRGFVGRNIGPFGSISGPPSSERFQHFDPTTSLVTFWDHTVQINDVLAEIKRLLPLVSAEARKPHWELDPKPPEEATDTAPPPDAEDARSDQSEQPPTAEEEPPSAS